MPGALDRIVNSDHAFCAHHAAYLRAKAGNYRERARTADSRMYRERLLRVARQLMIAAEALDRASRELGYER
jgi:hypothetical protein